VVVALVSADDLVDLVRRDVERYAPRASRVRLDPIPDGSLGLRAYQEPGDPSTPIDDERRDYDVVGVVTIVGEVAEIQLTKGEIPAAAWPDFDDELYARGVRVARWTRHRKTGPNKPVERRITSSKERTQWTP
jgi:hypothetical protein